MWQQSMGQCGHSFIPLYPKQSNTEALCAVSSPSSFLPSTKQHGEGNILLTVEIKTLSSPKKNKTGPQMFKCWILFIYFKVKWNLAICVPILYDVLFSWYGRQTLDIFCLTCNGLFCKLWCFANEGLLPPRYAHFYSFPPSLSASCNLILLHTRAPPPRPLIFPLIHSEVPQGVNNYTPVYSHYMASAGLI